VALLHVVPSQTKSFIHDMSVDMHPALLYIVIARVPLSRLHSVTVHANQKTKALNINEYCLGGLKIPHLSLLIQKENAKNDSTR
jgi:hypothetical protein